MEERSIAGQALSRIQVAELAASLIEKLPELKSKLSQLLPELLNRFDIDGKPIAIHEGKNDVWKVIQGYEGKELIFVFPSSEKLDKDSQSSDKDVAKKANDMKRFEMRIDKALHHKPPLRVQVKFEPKIDDDPTPNIIDASRITAVFTFNAPDWK